MKKINTDIKKNVVNYILNILNLKFGILQNYLANRIYDNNKLFDNFNTTQKNLINIEKKENKSIESIPAKNFANIENYINSISQNEGFTTVGKYINNVSKSKNYEYKNKLKRIIQRITNPIINKETNREANKKTNIVNQQKNILDFIWNKNYIQDNEKKYNLPQIIFSKDENIMQNALIKDIQNSSFVKTINGSHKTGLSRVPYDGYIAETHKNEAILNADDANVWRNLQFVERGDGTEFDKKDINLNYTSTINISNTNDKSVEDDFMKILNYHKEEIYQMLANVVNRNNAKSYI